MSEKFLFFWGTGDTKTIQKGCLSQWWPCRFVEKDIEYNCAEQYMMAEKARLFGDEEIRKRILSSDKPRLIKKLGREVRNFDPEGWDLVKFEVVKRGNLAKFLQNEDLRNFLLGTGDAILAEASPVDRIWGIGLGEDDPDVRFPERWKGENLLGKALMEVRKFVRIQERRN